MADELDVVAITETSQQNYDFLKLLCCYTLIYVFRYIHGYCKYELLMKPRVILYVCILNLTQGL